jgi:hypothetical protein
MSSTLFLYVLFSNDNVCRLRSDPLPTNKTLLKEVRLQ